MKFNTRQLYGKYFNQISKVILEQQQQSNKLADIKPKNLIHYNSISRNIVNVYDMNNECENRASLTNEPMHETLLNDQTLHRFSFNKKYIDNYLDQFEDNQFFKNNIDKQKSY